MVNGTSVYKQPFTTVNAHDPHAPHSRRNPKARKMRILVAAGVVFAKAGFAAGSVREISLKARVNVASINYYFSSKEGLYREVLLAAHRKLLEQEPPPKPTEEPEQSLGMDSVLPALCAAETHGASGAGTADGA